MKSKLYIFLILTAMLMTACKPSLPEDVLSEDDMVDVLYDMHKAQAMFESKAYNREDMDLIALRTAVLKKYDLTQEEWEISMQYYTSHADALHNIYLTLSDRVQRDVMAAGGKVDGVQTDDTDSTNVWTAASDIILMQIPYNILSFDITPDSTFQDGDRITLQFDTQFIFQDGYRDLAAYMAVSYGGMNEDGTAAKTDSIAVGMTHVTSDGHGVITINNDVDRLHIQKIRGYIMLTQLLVAETTETQSTTLRLASLRNIKLLHQHTIAPALKSEENTAEPSTQEEETQTEPIKQELETTIEPTPRKIEITNEQIPRKLEKTTKPIPRKLERTAVPAQRKVTKGIEKVLIK